MSFFTSDYVRDTRVLSLEARAVWMDMLCMMWDGDRRGYFSAAGKPRPIEHLARYCGCSAEVAEGAVAEILAAGIASKTDEGVIYSRRIVRDEKRRRANVVNGRRGGNPSLSSSDKRSDNPPDNPAHKAPLDMEYGIENGVRNERESSSGGGVGEGPSGIPPALDTPEFRQAWTQWLDYRREKRKKVTPTQAKEKLRQLAEWGPQVAVRSIRESIGNGWQGLFKPEENGKAPAAGGLLAGEAWAAVVKVVDRWGDKLWKRWEEPADWWDDRKRKLAAAQREAFDADLAALPPLARQTAENQTWRMLIETTPRSIAFANFTKIFNELAARERVT